MIAILANPVVSADSEDDAKVAESRSLAQLFGAELKTALESTLAEGGPMAALNVCKDRAPRIAAELSRQSGANVGRVSRRFRNPANSPEPWQIKVLEGLETAQATDESIDE